MEKISVLIVEDASLVAEDIASKLLKHNIDVAGIFASGEEAIESMHKKIPDLILMDIHLAGALDGVSAAHIIGKEHDIPVIYLTDHVDKVTVDRARKTFPANYLSKPFNEFDLIRSIDIAFTNWQAREQKREPGILKDFIFIKKDQTYVKVLYNDIIYLEADRSYCRIITESSVFMQTNNMRHIFNQFAHKEFIKVHRSYIINSNKITAIEGNVITLGKYKVEMSREMRDALVGKIKILK